MRHQACLAIAAYCAENATHQTASPVPADEGTELPPEDGLAQWNLAVKLQDAPQPVEQETEWALL